MKIFSRLCPAILGFAITASMATANPVVPVSISTRTNLAGAGGSFTPVLSADGQIAAFVSYANNLATDDDLAPWLDVFVRDLRAGTTTLVSVNTSGHGGGNGDSADPAISADGRYLAFASEAANLVPNDTNQASDVFVYDRLAGTNQLVSVNRYGGTSLGRPSLRPVISANGRWIVFESMADDLAEDQITSQRVRHLYARDLQAAKTYLVSAPVGTTNFDDLPLSYESHSPVLSADGSRIAFVSTLTNLVPGVGNVRGEVFVRDLAAQTTVWGSSNITADAAYYPVISADGRYLAFKASRDYMYYPEYVFFCDLQTGQSRQIAERTVASTCGRR